MHYLNENLDKIKDSEYIQICMNPTYFRRETPMIFVFISIVHESVDAAGLWYLKSIYGPSVSVVVTKRLRLSRQGVTDSDKNIRNSFLQLFNCDFSH